MNSQAAKTNQGSKWIEKYRRLAIYIRDGFACVYCGEDLRQRHAMEVTLDHIIPRSKGGTHETTNLVTACNLCNSSRGNKSVKAFAPGGAAARIERQRRLPINIELAKMIIKGLAGDPRVEARRAAVTTVKRLKKAA